MLVIERLVAASRPTTRESAETTLRILMVCTLLVVLTSSSGCSKDSASPPASTSVSSASNQMPSAITNSATPHTEHTEQDAPEFDPRLSLKWPSAPQESRRRIDAGTEHETMIYSATLSQQSPVTIFSATVHQFSKQDLQGTDPTELLAMHGSSGDEVELTRKPIEHGQKKLFGVDRTAKDEAGFLRRVNVLTGTRIYSIQVLSLNQEHLNSEEVTQFFDSFVIQD